MPELIFGLIVFGLFYWFVAKKIVPTLEKVYAERTAAIWFRTSTQYRPSSTMR